VSRASRPKGPCRNVPVPRGTRPTTRPLDAAAREAIDLFARLLDNCGYSRAEVARAFNGISAPRSPTVAATSAADSTLTDDAAHVITLWHMTAGYVDSLGDPLPLPVLGPAPSIESLVRLARRQLTLEGALQYFRTARTLKRAGTLFVPRSRVVHHPRATRFQAAHHLRVVAGLMRTVQTNHCEPYSRRRFEFAADGLVPKNKRRAFDRDFAAVGIEMLKSADALMLRYADASKPRKRQVPLTVGAYVFEGRPPPAHRTPRLSSKPRAKQREARPLATP
jgi:hypothetical protein